MDIGYISSARKQFAYYKLLGEKTFAQLTDDELFWQPNADTNSVAIIVKHLWGNMRSRWTDFLTTDGEKAWRDRDAEFDDAFRTRALMVAEWEEGWCCLFAALDSLTDNDLERIIYIRNEGHTVLEAINRQLAHYPYHVGRSCTSARPCGRKNGRACPFRAELPPFSMRRNSASRNIAAISRTECLCMCTPCHG